MAVQKNRKTRSKRGMRRAHNALASPALSVDAHTGELHYRHHMTETGYYRGKQVIDLSESTEVEDDEEDDS